MDLEKRVDLKSCVSGDSASWEIFVRAAAPIIIAAVRRAIQRRGTDSSEIDDRVQDVFVQLVKRDFHLLRAFAPSRARLSTYLTVISRSVVRDGAARRAPPIDRAASAHRVEDPRTEHERRRKRAQEEVDALPIEMLSDQQRTILGLLHQQDCSVEQVAERLGVTTQTVRSAKHKALERIRAFLADRDGDIRREPPLSPNGASRAPE